MQRWTVTMDVEFNTELEGEGLEQLEEAIGIAHRLAKYLEEFNKSLEVNVVR